MPKLIDKYDAALFDLDGVVYRGNNPIAAAVPVLNQLAADNIALGYVTNNASRTPQEVAQKLENMGISTKNSVIVTSAQAIIRLMRRELGSKSRIFVLGAAALAQEAKAADFKLVSIADISAGEKCDAVVQGYNPQGNIADIQAACIAIENGARWYASNLDLTIPVEDGIVPGMGSYVNLVAAAVKTRPVGVAGKPYPELIETALAKLVNVQRPIFVGDRLDTDIAGANNLNLDSLFVFTGVHGKYDLASADQNTRPRHIGYSLADLMTPPVTAASTAGSVSKNGDHLEMRSTCANAVAAINENVLILENRLVKNWSAAGVAEQLDGLRAALALIWKISDKYSELDSKPELNLAALDKLDKIP